MARRSRRLSSLSPTLLNDGVKYLSSYVMQIFCVIFGSIGAGLLYKQFGLDEMLINISGFLANVMNLNWDRANGFGEKTNSPGLISAQAANEAIRTFNWLFPLSIVTYLCNVIGGHITY